MPKAKPAPSAARLTRPPRMPAAADAKLRRLAGTIDGLLAEVDACLADRWVAGSCHADDLNALAWVARCCQGFIDSELAPARPLT